MVKGELLFVASVLAEAQSSVVAVRTRDVEF